MRPLLEVPVDQRSQEQREAVAASYRVMAPMLQPARNRIADLNKSLADLGIVTAMVFEERDSDRAATDFHVRGSYLNKGERVYANVPSSLNPLKRDEPLSRLGLAEWLVDEDNPLTARVTVNRYWEALFGHGIVETSEDFGTQGDRPVHPELLDWLAVEFMQKGWDIKALLRMMVASATYRQSSAANPELIARDPYNRLLAHGPRFRVAGESVRDIALSTSGLLSPAIGGPSVFPYQPEGVWDRPYSSERWVMSEGEDRHRRSLYTFVRRTAPYPSMSNFDAPSRESCTVRRPRTNTPLQALTTLNDPVFVEAAQSLAKRVVHEAPSDPVSKASYAFRLCTSRWPNSQESDRLLAYYRQELQRYQQDPQAAVKVAGEKGSAADAPELAAWTMAASLLLSLDEALTKE